MNKESPGKFPYKRGIYREMYKEKSWTMRQYAGFTSSEESNQRFLKLLENGVMGLSIAFDLPTQIGYDSDHPMACLLYTSPSPRDMRRSRMPSSA